LTGEDLPQQQKELGRRGHLGAHPFDKAIFFPGTPFRRIEEKHVEKMDFTQPSHLSSKPQHCKIFNIA
jgi:hypothetical protein